MKILMTAFEPFGNNQFNSTITALNNIDLENVTKLILPVTYPGAFQYLKSNLNNLEYCFVGGDNVSPTLIEKFNQYAKDSMPNKFSLNTLNEPELK